MSYFSNLLGQTPTQNPTADYHNIRLVDLVTQAMATMQGVEVLTAPADTSISATIPVSILINPTETSQTFNLPDGIDGQIKELVNGANNTGSNNSIYVTCHNNLGNDGIDLNANCSIRLVWVTSKSGWIALSGCTTVNSLWD